MSVKYLDITRYFPNGNWEIDLIENPSWEQISDSIYKLDRNLYPFIWLDTSEPFEHPDSENALLIMGGLGEYYISIYSLGSYIEFYDNSRPEEEVLLWESDQGFSTTKQNLCNSVEATTTIAKYFAESGQRFPKVNWKNS